MSVKNLRTAQCVVCTSRISNPGGSALCRTQPVGVISPRTAQSVAHNLLRGLDFQLEDSQIRCMLHTRLCTGGVCNTRQHPIKLDSNTCRRHFPSRGATTCPRPPSTVPSSCSAARGGTRGRPWGYPWCPCAPGGARPTWAARRHPGARSRGPRASCGGPSTLNPASTGPSIGMGPQWNGDGLRVATRAAKASLHFFTRVE